MKYLLFFLCLSTNVLVAQPPLPNVEDGMIILYIDQPLIVLFLCISIYTIWFKRQDIALPLDKHS